jgi:DDE superfamily endonuclease/Tc5 transposase DNA-binding domain/helix-turn-helix, Psq domain
MTCPNNPNAAEKEARLQEAIAAVLNDKHTCHSAAIVFNVPRRTLYDRVKGNKKPRNQAHELDQNLTHAEEKELVRWITLLTISGYPPRYETLRRLAEIIRERRVKKTDDKDAQVPVIVYDKIGKDWVGRFLRRHHELASVRPRSIDAVRVKDTSPERLQRWFDDLEKVLAEFNIKLENIYNMDESGFAIGEKEASRCIINSNIRQQFQAKPGRQEWVSVLECICADGTIVPPLVIFKAEKLSTQWIPASIHGSWRFNCNSKGWTSNEHGLDWLIRCFDPETRNKAVGEYRLLICDGHDSHITAEFIAYCIDHKILLMILPPHSSHLTQPLDVGVFGSLKKHMASELYPLMRTGVARIQKVEWLTAFVAAHERALSAKNIRSGFRGTGIHPFLPTKVLRRVASSPQQESRPSTPNPLTPFNETVLTDSPVDFNAVKQANDALNTLIESGESLPSPAKKYVGHCTRSILRLHARNTILEQENADQKAILQARKRNLSGKRKVIDGKHLMTGAELVGIREAQEVTKQRKAPKKRGGKGTGKSKAKKESSDESDAYVDVTDDEAVEIFDCIEVEM